MVIPRRLAPWPQVLPDSGEDLKSDRLATGITDRVAPESVIGLDWNG